MSRLHWLTNCPAGKILLPDNKLCHGSPWGSLIQRAGDRVRDQSGQLLSSRRRKSVLKCSQGEQPRNRNRSHPEHHTWVFIAGESGLTHWGKSGLKMVIYYFFFLQNETLFWQSRLKHCLLSCTKDSQKSKVCLPNRSVILKIKHTMMPRHPGALFMERGTSHKWLPLLIAHSCGRGKSQSGHRWAELWSSEKKKRKEG